jgi:fused signal recognition particle receptor
VQDPEILALLESLRVWTESHLALVATLAGAALVVLIASLAVRLRRAQTRAQIAERASTREPSLPASLSDSVEEVRAGGAAPVSPEMPVEPVAPTPALEPAEAEPAPEPPRPLRLRDRLARTRESLVGRIERVLGTRRVDAGVLDEIEALLFGADLGVATAEDLLATVRKEAAGGDAARVREVLRGAIAAKLRRVEPPAGSGLATQAKPHVILVLGVNGSGKTTTIGKLAARFEAAGRRVILGAGDTFRAAASEQLEIWGGRVGCEVVTGRAGGDPSAVAFDTLKAAVARGADVAIIDTAGRLQTREPLVEELRKIVRVIGRELPGAPHETLLVLDANTGQNAIAQARVFTEAAGVTALALTKLDGTAKGGVLVGLSDAFGLPVRWVGVGEGLEDLREFSADEFVEALFETAPEESA